MNEVTRLTIHYLEAITRAARLTGFDEIRAELNAADEADEERRRAELNDLRARIDHAQEMIDTPNWRDRR